MLLNDQLVDLCISYYHIASNYHTNVTFSCNFYYDILTNWHIDLWLMGQVGDLDIPYYHIVLTAIGCIWLDLPLLCSTWIITSSIIFLTPHLELQSQGLFETKSNYWHQLQMPSCSALRLSSNTFPENPSWKYTFSCIRVSSIQLASGCVFMYGNVLLVGGYVRNCQYSLSWQICRPVWQYLQRSHRVKEGMAPQDGVCNNTVNTNLFHYSHCLSL